MSIADNGDAHFFARKVNYTIWGGIVTEQYSWCNRLSRDLRKPVDNAGYSVTALQGVFLFAYFLNKKICTLYRGRFSALI